MIVGFLGGTPFITSKNYLYTFKDYTRDAAARYAKHDIVNSKPVLEYLGPEQQTVSFDIKLRSDFGLSPRVEMDKLRKYCETGKVLTLILGGVVIGKTHWVIESVQEKANYWSATGQILSSDASLTLKEYPKRNVAGGLV